MLKRRGNPIEDGIVWAQDERGRSVMRSLHPTRLKDEGWLGLARERYRSTNGTLDGFRAFQIVLSDLNGRLPWEPGHDEGARRWQPELYNTAKHKDEAFSSAR
jgi:hypothetical protein